MDISKIDAARRQLDAAIRMLFGGEDPVAIHTLAAASFQILRDLARLQKLHVHELFRLGIKPGMESAFWKEFNRPASFMKHADKDPDGEHVGFNEEANDGLLFAGSIYFQALGNELSVEMQSIIAYFCVRHPEFLREPVDPQLSDAVRKGDSFRQMSRADHLSIAKQGLEIQLVAAGRRYGPK